MNKPFDIHDLRWAIRQRGHGAIVIPGEQVGKHRLPAYVNIYLHRDDNRPNETVYEPHDDESWVWGPNFEHTAPRDVPLNELVDSIVSTLPEEPE
jgi:hypothetical protein